MDCSNIRSSRGGQHHGAAAKRLVGQRLGVDVMSRHLVCSTLVVATLILAVCSSACVQTQDEHRPAAQALADLRASAEAQFILGGIHVTGVGVPPDVAEAVGWYRRAAEQGHARAQYNLGGMYAEGLGVPQDAAEALAWYRRAQGAHYTTEKNILKVIEPLFLDDLRAELNRLRARKDSRRRAELRAFQKRLGEMRFFDPACGCGNFLIIAYRELRELEIELIRELRRGRGDETQRALDTADLSRITVDQFYGIEIGEFPARIAETAL